MKSIPMAVPPAWCVAPLNLEVNHILVVLQKAWKTLLPIDTAFLSLLKKIVCFFFCDRHVFVVMSQRWVPFYASKSLKYKIMLPKAQTAVPPRLIYICNDFLLQLWRPILAPRSILLRHCGGGNNWITSLSYCFHTNGVWFPIRLHSSIVNPTQCRLLMSIVCKLKMLNRKECRKAK